MDLAERQIAPRHFLQALHLYMGAKFFCTRMQVPVNMPDEDMKGLPGKFSFANNWLTQCVLWCPVCSPLLYA